MTALAAIAGAWVLLITVLWLAQRQIIYLPDRSVGSVPDDVTVQTVDTPDGITHHVWLVPADGEPLARVVVFNGNAGNKGHRLDLARNLAAQGMEVTLFDYRGYGDTEGKPNEEGLLTDAASVAEMVFDSSLPVVYFGESLGAGVATALATRRPPHALVLRSPFTSLADMARAHYPFVPPFLVRDRYPVEDQVATTEIALLVLLGTADSIVPPEQSRRVFEAASGHKGLIEMEGLNHNDPGLTSSPELVAEVLRFLNEAGVTG
jgi:alpha-beta hydrolase superfamily lysophospholipase